LEKLENRIRELQVEKLNEKKQFKWVLDFFFI
jgi:hypothetical protein